MGKVFVVIDEINLHASLLDRRYLDDQGMIGIVDDQVHAREPDHLVKLVASFVDQAKSRHEGADLVSGVLNALWQLASDA